MGGTNTFSGRSTYHLLSNYKPTTKFISWDFALTDAGWIVVELGWGQMIAQVSLQKGLKREFLQLLLGE